MVGGNGGLVGYVPHQERASEACVNVKYPKKWHEMDVLEDPVVLG
jgi:hypothetical protein